MKRMVEQLGAFNEIAKALTSTLEGREVLEVVMEQVSALLHPTHWSLLLQDEKTSELYFEIAVGPMADRLKQMRVSPTEGIAGAVFSTGQPRLVEDAQKDAEFSRRFDQTLSFRTRSVVAAPLKFRGRVLGVIELINAEGAPAFTADDLQAITTIADFAAIALENSRNFKRVQELTLTDEHTGLYNVRHLRALLEKEVARAQRFHHPVSLIFLDLDRFKQVNDTYGHLVGSRLLKEVGQLLVTSIRQVDSAFRYGGDEYAVVLIETDPQGARIIAERIRDAFRTWEFLSEDGLKLKLTASLGVATFPDHAASGPALLEAADRAMYQAKAKGRDDVATAA